MAVRGEACAGMAVVLAFPVAACAGQPTIDVSPEAERSFDGLYPVANTTMDKVWARSDLDLTGYTKIMVQSLGIQYRPTRPSAGSRSAARRGETEFPLSESQKQRLKDTVGKAFRKELDKLERFEVVDAPGPDVLLVRGALLDVVSRVPPEPVGRAEIYLDSVGQATLLIELIDSQTESVLMRAVDTRAAEQSRGVMIQSTSVTNTEDVRRLAEIWARMLRSALDTLATTILPVSLEPASR